MLGPGACPLPKFQERGVRRGDVGVQFGLDLGWELDGTRPDASSAHNPGMGGGFIIRGEIRVLGTIAINRSIREITSLKRLHGPGRWRKMKGEAMVELDDPSEVAISPLCEKRRLRSVAGATEGLRALSNAKAESHGLVRVIDESGEDYLYPAAFFLPVVLPVEAARAFAPSRLRRALETVHLLAELVTTL